MRTELSRLKALATTLPPDPRQSISPPTSPVPPYSPSAQSPLSRFNSVHVRSASMSSRPSTPTMSSPTRSHTPAPPPTRSQTPSIRSQTPSIRSYTPGPQTQHRPTPAPLRMQTPAPPPVPHKPRRLSTPSPPKMMRSTSEEKAEVHERWFPNMEQDKPKYGLRPPSRASYSTSSNAAAARYRSPSPHS